MVGLPPGIFDLLHYSLETIEGEEIRVFWYYRRFCEEWGDLVGLSKD